MDQNEQQLRSRDYTSYFESLNSSYTRNGGSMLFCNYLLHILISIGWKPSFQFYIIVEQNCA